MRTETFQTPGHVALDVRLGSGEVDVRTDEVTTTTVELDGHEETLEQARVESRERAGGFEVIVDLSKAQRRWGRGRDVFVRVTVPLGADLECRSGSADIGGRGHLGSVDIETGSGEVDLDDLSGDAKISGASGDIEIASVAGEARINVASGDVEIESVGRDAHVNSASGDVTIREVGGGLHVNSASGDVLVREVGDGASVNTASGDQEIGAVRQGSVSLKSASGDLRVGIKEGSSLYVDARSRSGEVSSELDVTSETPDGEGPLVELRANTMSGDIQIVRA
jgi:DUF4097 and DUF4098 domain-containing protein YvlB